MKNKLFNAIVKISLLSMVLAMSFQVAPTNAASLLSISDKMSRLMDNLASDHEIRFKTPTGVDASTDTITITFPAGFDLATQSVAFGDMDLNIDPGCDGVYEVNKTLAAAAGASPIWGAAVAGQVVTLTAPTDAAVGEIAANACVQVLIGENATGGAANNQIENPDVGADTSYTISIAGVFGDTGSAVVQILLNDQVTITATIDPTFTFSLSTNTCALGTLDVGFVETCGVNLTTSTNAVGGYTTTIVGTATGDELIHANLTDDIDNAVGTDVSFGTEEFGVSTSEVDAVDIVKLTTHGTCAAADHVAALVDAESIDTLGDNTPARIATEATAISSDVVEACFAATISGTTAAGLYTAVVTFVSTGTF